MATAAARKRRYNTPRANYDSVAYDLDYAETAARPLRGGEQTRTRPLVRPRERAAGRPKARRAKEQAGRGAAGRYKPE